MSRSTRICLSALFALFTFLASSACRAVDFYVSPSGNDDWTGRNAAATANGTDGPLQTLAGAQKAWRAAMKSEKPDRVRVFLRGGTWYCDKTLEITAADRAVPLSLEAYNGEKPVLLGSVPVETRRVAGGLLEAAIPEASQDAFAPGRVFSDETMVRARQPNRDASDPIHRGFFHVEKAYSLSAICSGSVGCIHNPGDSLEYDISVATGGNYTVWMVYGANNAMYNIRNLDGRMTFQFNDEKPVPVLDTPNTGGWKPERWAKAGLIPLKPDKGVFRWKNNKGGGINIGLFVLSADPNWTPVGKKRLFDGPVDPSLIILPADRFRKGVGRQLSVSGSGSKDAFVFHDGDLKPEWAVPGVELKIFQSGSCRAYQEIVGVKSIVSVPVNLVILEGVETTATLAAGDRYYLENHSAFLDAPGEWYFDRKNATLRIVPVPGAKEYRHARLATIIAVKQGAGEKVEPLCLSGLTFGETGFTRDEGCVGYSMGKYGVIQLDAAERVTVGKCRFFRIGRYAVAVDKGRRNTVSRCEIEHGAQGGVLLTAASENTVADCSMNGLGEEYKHIGGVVVNGDGSKNVIEHNYIANSSRYGITLKSPGSENRVAFNDVWNTSLETFDTGAIEVTQQNKTFQSGSVIANNRVVATNGYSTSFAGSLKPVYLSWGIYLDSFAGGYLVENNYVCDTHQGGFMYQGGQGNTVRNNIFCNACTSQGHISNYANNFSNIRFENNIVSWTDPNAAFFRRGNGVTTDVFICRNNVYFPPANAEAPTKAACELWMKSGIDSGSLFADPLYVHPDGHDGQLKPESPALRLGFKQLDLSTVGPRK